MFLYCNAQPLSPPVGRQTATCRDLHWIETTAGSNLYLQVYSFKDVKNRRKLLKLCTQATFIANNNTVCPRIPKTNKLFDWNISSRQFWCEDRARESFFTHGYLFQWSVSHTGIFECILVFHFKFAGLKLSLTNCAFAFSFMRLNTFQNLVFPLCVYVLHLQMFPNQFSDKPKS